MTFELERAKRGRKPFTVVEMDLDYCEHIFGVDPCIAAIKSVFANVTDHEGFLQPLDAAPDVFNSGSGNVTVPIGATGVTITEWGAGGGGNDGSAVEYGTGGGGGGSGARVVLTTPILASEWGTTLAYAVGAAGGESSNGGASTSSGTLNGTPFSLSAGGGIGSTGLSGGAGGTASGGDNTNGNAGANGQSGEPGTQGGDGGDGGAAPGGGGGGAGGAGGAGGPGDDGNVGTAPGGGGGGGGGAGLGGSNQGNGVGGGAGRAQFAWTFGGLQLAASASAVDDAYNGKTLTVAGQVFLITDYIGASRGAVLSPAMSPVITGADAYIVSHNEVRPKTGDVKCFNARAHCQDSAHYSPQPKTYRFCSNVQNVPRDLDALPFVADIKFQPTKLSSGSGLGLRGSVSVTFLDGKHNDRGIDKYVDERGYDALEQGTFWGRFLSRNRYFLGRPLRVWTGYLTRNANGASTFDFANARQHVFYMERAEGPHDGKVTITAKDVLKKADDARAVYPKPAQGRLLAAITAGAGAATLTPTGVGDLAYSASGKLRINGEIISFTRVGDALTLTGRGQNFTVAAAHGIDDAVQECAEFIGKKLYEIVYTLLTVGAEIDPSFISLPDWEQENLLYTDGRLYNGLLAEPIGVNELVTELCEQGPAYFFQNERTGAIIYRALRPASSATVAFTHENNFIAGSVKAQTRLDLRISSVIVYFGQRDPTEPLDKGSNYQAASFKIGDGIDATKYGETRTKIIYSRWLNASSRVFADSLAGAYLQRYDEAPRQIDFVVPAKDGDTGTGDLFTATTPRLQGPDGLSETVAFQALSRMRNDDDQIVISALEERFAESESGQRTIILSGDKFLDYNLRAEFEKLYGVPTSAITLTVTVLDSVIIGSTSTATPAFNVGSWPDGTVITINLLGRLAGRGGKGGDGMWYGAGSIGNGLPGETGGLALYTRFPVTIDCTAGAPKIYGGGGGGGGGAIGSDAYITNGGGGGGGGAGSDDSAVGKGGNGEGNWDGQDGLPGTPDAGGVGGIGGVSSHGFPGAGGNGGGPALVGAAGGNGDAGYTGGAGGQPGKAIDGLSFITFVGSADIRGAQIN